MILDAMTMAYLLNRCAGPVAAPGTMAAIVSVESAKRPWAIHDNLDGASYFPSTYGSAVALATELNARGHTNLDLGLAQVNEGNLAAYRVSIPQILTTCRNLTVASMILRGGWRTAIARYGTAPTMLPFVITGAVQAYNSGSLFGSPTYAMRVVQAYYSPDVRNIQTIADGLWQRAAAAPATAQTIAISAVVAASSKKKKSRPTQKHALNVADTFVGSWNR